MVETTTSSLDAVVIPLRAHLAQAGALVAVFDLPATRDIEERELLASFADQAALALDRAQAVSDRERLAVITDRERIARDLHDVVIQRLFATGLRLRRDRARAADSDVDEPLTRPSTTSTARSRTSAPRSSSSRTGRTRRCGRRFARWCGSTFRCWASPRTVGTIGPLDTAVTPAVREHLLPVLREAVSNIARHALGRARRHRGAGRRSRAATRRGRRRCRSLDPGRRERAAQRPPPSHRAPGHPRADRQRAARHPPGVDGPHDLSHASFSKTSGQHERPPALEEQAAVRRRGLPEDRVALDQRQPGQPFSQAPGVAGVVQTQDHHGDGAEQVVVEDRVVLRRERDGPHQDVHRHAGHRRETHPETEGEREADPEQAEHEQPVDQAAPAMPL